MGAHYDGPLHSPSADDNASGLAASLELAKRWRAQPPHRPDAPWPIGTNGRYVKTKVLPVPNRGAAIPDVRISDHSPFWDQGYNALMVTDTSYMRNPHYHQMSDTVDTLDLPFFCQVVNGLDAALSRL